MDTDIILTYCACDDYLKSLNYQESDNIIMSNAEVLTHIFNFIIAYALKMLFKNRPALT